MSEFSCPIVNIDQVEPIEGADQIEVVSVLGWKCVTKKGEFKENDLAVYIPEASVVPKDLLAKMGLEGRLSGAGKNRVKAIKLRKVLSQGLLLTIRDFEAWGYYKDHMDGSILKLDTDISGILGIEKWSPVIPAHLVGEVGNYHGRTIRYDIENIKSHPGVFIDGEMVEFSEKIHGTFCGVTIIPGLNDPEMLYTNTLVYSKGQGAKGFVFKDNLANEHNLYLKTIKKLKAIDDISNRIVGYPIHILGEIYGIGVQDLGYDQIEPKFRAFDVVYEDAGNFRYLGRKDFHSFCSSCKIDTVPILYSGPFSQELLNEYTSGNSEASPETCSSFHIREGVVIRPFEEGTFGKNRSRKILKSVSAAYLLRKGETTEFN